MITRKTSPVPKTKQRIADAALALFVSQGIAETTTRDIAREAGIAEGTIYRHFASKEDIARDLFLENFLPFCVALKKIQGKDVPMIDRLGQMVAQFYQAYDAQPQLWIYVMTYQTGPRAKVPDDTPTPYRIMCELLEEATSTGEIGNIDAPLYAQLLLGMIEQPAAGFVYGEMEGALTPRVSDVVAAMGRVLNL